MLRLHLRLCVSVCACMYVCVYVCVCVVLLCSGESDDKPPIRRYSELMSSKTSSRKAEESSFMYDERPSPHTTLTVCMAKVRVQQLPHVVFVFLVFFFLNDCASEILFFLNSNFSCLFILILSKDAPIGMRISGMVALTSALPKPSWADRT